METVSFFKNNIIYLFLKLIYVAGLDACFKAGKLVDESKFEVKSDTVAADGPRKGRLRVARKVHAGLAVLLLRRLLSFFLSGARIIPWTQISFCWAL